MFTSGHKAYLLAPVIHTQTQAWLFQRRLCPPVTAHTGQLVVWSSWQTEKELPAVSKCRAKNPKIWELCLVPEMSVAVSCWQVCWGWAAHRSDCAEVMCSKLFQTAFQISTIFWHKMAFHRIRYQCHQNTFTCAQYSQGTKWVGL